MINVDGRAGCRVRNVYFAKASDKQQLCAFVELGSAEDVKLALSRNGRYIHMSRVFGRWQ